MARGSRAALGPVPTSGPSSRGDVPAVPMAEASALLALLGEEPIASTRSWSRAGSHRARRRLSWSLELQRARTRIDGRGTSGAEEASWRDGHPGRGRVTHEGEDHPEVPRPGIRGEGIARAPEGPPEEQARHRRQEGFARSTSPSDQGEDAGRPEEGRQEGEGALRRHRPRPGRRRSAGTSPRLKLPPDKVYRVLFNEITEKAVKAAFKAPGRIDQKRSTLSRRGACSTAWSATRSARSSGRRSAASVGGARPVGRGPPDLRAGAGDRAFVPRSTGASSPPGRGRLPSSSRRSGRRTGRSSCPPPRPRPRPSSPSSSARPSWSRPSTRASGARTRRRPSSRRLQQDAGRKLRFSASKTMMVAQQLYEGVEIDNGGPVGLITYMRTDSPRVAAEAQTEARDVIAARYGPTRFGSPPVLPGPKDRPGSPRGDPADAARPRAGAPGPSPEPRPARALPADLGAVPGEQMRPALYDT